MCDFGGVIFLIGNDGVNGEMKYHAFQELPVFYVFFFRVLRLPCGFL